MSVQDAEGHVQSAIVGLPCPAFSLNRPCNLTQILEWRAFFTLNQYKYRCPDQYV